MEIVSTVCVYVGMQYGDCEYVCMWECSMEIVSVCVCGNAVWRL